MPEALNQAAPAPEQPAEPAPTPAPQPTPAPGTYVVILGDTLGKIALEHYGSAGLWERIFKANTDIVKDPNVIFPGQVLAIPAK